MDDDTIAAVRAKDAVPVSTAPVRAEHNRSSTSRYTNTVHLEHVVCGCFVVMPKRWRMKTSEKC